MAAASRCLSLLALSLSGAWCCDFLGAGDCKAIGLASAVTERAWANEMRSRFSCTTETIDQVRLLPCDATHKMVLAAVRAFSESLTSISMKTHRRRLDLPGDSKPDS
ncbi:hypothetical protein M441DRAFT_445739 [Trichoderma asperellum CBS 433.97]|uniref:Secreted protein n=1 Tax=Trichoderma asperellum (strain ATCC 204424 / CBS 433.97 / NBRC 101777) TaxID=1042311 RepID=A0A2T3ZQJ4_TRIA4|nr:hypothetical protein M441DRAFT_445739 [Trichoderma asperellum CBS 433.97]PTB47090.1 hypothetical protein M441DRAFT_445739 [Trichoderma asperellum CBS 433.97]